MSAHTKISNVEVAMTIPLIVGVTGHRDLIEDEIPIIKKMVRSFFLDLRESFPGLPLMLLSPLASGADQLAAEVAFELNIETVALLPMPADEYRRDFEGDDLTKFEQLLKGAPLVEIPMVAEDPGKRDQQYVSLAAYLTAHCHILLALWDGADVDAPGGTSSTIRFHQHETMTREGAMTPMNPIDFIEDESDLVYHIRCNRRSSEERDELECGWLTRDDVNPETSELPQRYQAIFRRMVEFNHDSASISVSDTSGLIESSDIDSAAKAGTESMEKLFQLSDQLAQKYQRVMFRALRLAYSFVALAALSFIVYADLYSERLMVYLYVILVGVVLVIFKVEEKLSWQRKYLDYRALAEALRVQFYWSLAGVQMRRRFHFSHDSFHERRDLELGWIRHVMRYASLEADNNLHRRSAEQTESVIDSWIRDPAQGQLTYYQRKAGESRVKTNRTQIVETASMLIVVLLAVTIVSLSEDSFLKNLLIASAGFLPIIAAIRQNYAHRTSERELMGQFHYFSRIFANADQLLQRTGNVETRREILRALGIAALDESSQWVLRQRERPVSSGAILG